MKKCCEKCLIFNSSDKDRKYPECLNPRCPCHATPTGEKEDYSHTHCFDQKEPPCGQKEHTRCCLCERKSPTPQGSVRERFLDGRFEYSYFNNDQEETLIFYNTSQKELLSFIEEEVERAREEGNVARGAIESEVKMGYLAQGKKEGRTATIKEIKKKVEGMKKEGNNGEGLPFENSPEIYGNARQEAYKKGYNEALTHLAASLEE